MPRYDLDPGAVFYRRDHANAQVLGDWLADITAKHGGKLKPEHVVEAAKPRSSPGHQHFQWNDKLAAYHHRKDQARALIAAVRIISDDDINGEAARAFHNIRDDGRSYRLISEIVTSSVLQLELLKTALREVQAFEHRFASIAEVCPSVRVLKNVRAEIERAILAEDAANERRKKAKKKTRKTVGRRRHTSESRPSA